jgi:hypothetical protein
MQSKLRARRHVAALGLLLSGASACAAGGGAGAAKFAAEPEPSTVEEAQAQLSRAREQIEGPPASRVSVGAPATGAAGAGGATPAPAAPPVAPASISATSAADASMESAPSPRADACALPCHAIASMRRAVDAICRMAGAQDARCVEARKTLSDDEVRVAPCGC